MTFWQLYKSSASLKQDPKANVIKIYSLPAGELVLYLRVVLAEWIESSIGTLSPENFFRGLNFQLEVLEQANREGKVTNIIYHPTYLSKCKNLLLSNYKTSRDKDALYLKLVQCLGEEYKVVRLLQNMEEPIPQEVLDLINAHCANNASTEMNCGTDIEFRRRNISIQVANVKENELKFNHEIERLTSYQNRFHDSYEMYNKKDLPDNLRIVLSGDLLDEGANILKSKKLLEEIVKHICNEVATLINHLKVYMHLYERLHVFSHRTCSATNVECTEGIEEMFSEADKAITFLEKISPPLNKLKEINFEGKRNIVHDASLNLNHRNASDLLDKESYKNRFDTFLNELNLQKLTIYQTIALVVDCQPPMVIMKSTHRPISLRVFNIFQHSKVSDDFEIKVYLVNESTVNDIRTKNLLPKNIPSAGNIAIIEEENGSSKNNLPNSVGRIGSKSRIRMSTDQQTTTSQITGTPVVTLKEKIEKYPWGKKCFLVRKEVIIQSRPSRSPGTTRGKGLGKKYRPKKNKNDDDAVTSDKVALLFVMTLPFENSTHQVWTISLPVIVAAHGSQYEKAYLTVAWDDALAIPNRRGFEVNLNAKWPEILQMLMGTFAASVGSELKPSHIEYLRKKAQQCLGNNFQEISKKALSGDHNPKAISFWTWFFKAVSIVKENAHFHDAWKEGYIEGFIGYEAASKLLSKPYVQPGTFVIRFSDTIPGSLTFVFTAPTGEIYKMEPLEVYKWNSLKACGVDLLRLLNGKYSSQDGTDVFKYLYPDIPKMTAFDKFYKEVGNQKISSGYIGSTNLISLGNTKTSPGSILLTENMPGNASTDTIDVAATSRNDSNLYEDDNMEIDENISGLPEHAVVVPYNQHSQLPSGSPAVNSSDSISMDFTDVILKAIF